MDYEAKIKRHLSAYKISHLKIMKDGKWKNNDKTYPHILPEDLQQLNILETIREEFWIYFKKQRIIRHRDFHHLNSSQAMCFNLFYPFILYGYLQSLLLDILNINKNESIEEIKFEKVPNKDEGTNFDFYIKLKSNTEIFFEIKFSESDFGNVVESEVYRERLKTIYERPLSGIIPEEYLKPKLFCENYQILRNIYYLTQKPENHLFLIYPRENNKLLDYERTIKTIIGEKLQNRVSIFYLEDLVNNILETAQVYNEKVEKHFLLFKEKYLNA
jgi:hypothetical protein